VRVVIMFRHSPNFFLARIISGSRLRVHRIQG
jgi:hypothetical protein